MVWQRELISVLMGEKFYKQQREMSQNATRLVGDHNLLNYQNSHVSNTNENPI